MNGFVKMTGISAVLAAAGVLCGAESIAPQTLSDWAGVNQNVTQDAEGVITMKPKSTTISSKKAITVDPAKTYKLSGKFRKVPGSTVDTRIYFGLASCDEKGNPIPSGAVIVMPNTDTVLADAAFLEKDWSAEKPHLSVLRCARYAAAAGARCLLTHINPAYSEEEIRTEASLYPQAEIAEEGRTYEV